MEALFIVLNDLSYLDVILNRFVELKVAVQQSLIQWEWRGQL